MPSTTPTPCAPTFSPLANERPTRWARRLHLVPADGPDACEDALAWALDADGTPGFRGWRFAWVARPVPISSVSIARIVVPLAIPLLLVAALQIPLTDLLLRLLKLPV